MRGRRRHRAAALALFGAVGCARPVAHLPYDLSQVPTASAPVHPLRLTLIRLEDRRPVAEAPDDGGRFIYRGLEYEGTIIDHLGLDPMAELTLVIARHLAKARVFERVYVVSEAAEAPADTDLFLTGAVVRLRGYVEAEPPPGPSEGGGERPPDRAIADGRKVVAEAMLADLVVRRQIGAPSLARFDVGWSFHDERAASPVPPAPWAIAAEALRPTLDQLVRSLERARLDGEVRLEGVSLGALGALSETTTGLPAQLAAATPTGWEFETLTSTAPTDWRGQGPSCGAGRWRSRQEHRFLRRLGPYIPTVELWWCPAATALAWRGAAEFPARYLGADAEGRRWFGRQVGPSAWPGAPEAFARQADLRPSPARYRFRLGPGPDPLPVGDETSAPMLPAGAAYGPRSRLDAREPARPPGAGSTPGSRSTPQSRLDARGPSSVRARAGATAKIPSDPEALAGAHP